MQHYERTGEFAKAEDAFFSMLEAEPDNPPCSTSEFPFTSEYLDSLMIT